MSRLIGSPLCKVQDCPEQSIDGEFCEEHIRHVDHDPTPWCSGCGAMRKADCKCGPIAENE